MKKILSIMALAATVAFTACSDDTDNPYETVSSIQITGNAVYFDAPAAQGSITYSCTGNVSVTSSKDWCSAVLQGDSILVSATQNNDRYARTALITLRNGNDTIGVSVIQRGVHCQIVDATDGICPGHDKATTLSYRFVRNIDMEVQSTPSWVTTEVDGDSLRVTFTANNLRHARNGYIVYGNGVFTDSVRVFQADFDRDIAAKNYRLYYNKSTSTTIESSITNQNVSQTSWTLSTNSKYKLTIPVTYDKKAGTLNVQCGQYMGEWVVNDTTTYNVFNAFLTNDGAWTEYNTDSTVKGVIEYDEKERKTFIRFSGETAGYLLTGMTMRAFRKPTDKETGKELEPAMGKEYDTGRSVTNFTFYNFYLRK